MKVVMRISISGSRNGAPWPKAGEVADLPDAEAEHLLSLGHAKPVEKATAPPPAAPSAPAPETATAPAPEKRASKRAAKKA
jgi:hypothetical protein